VKQETAPKTTRSRQAIPMKAPSETPIAVLSPTGRPIRGTLERCSACRPVTFNVDANGQLSYEHDGRPPHLYAEQLRTLRRLGQPVFVDDDGTEWLLSQLVVKRTTDNAPQARQATGRLVGS
jgi:hypothetical protein